MAHTHEYLCFASDVFIVNNDAVLLRMHDKYDMWLPPGGHVEPGEDIVEAAIREAKEETGLSVILLGTRAEPVDSDEQELLIPRFINRHFVSKAREHVSFIYFGTSRNRDIVPEEGEKSDGFKWFSKEELENPSCEVGERTKHYALEALKVAASENAVN